ncbi:decapping endonuclease targeting mRNA, partial [Entomortierella lignicola]
MSRPRPSIPHDDNKDNDENNKYKRPGNDHHPRQQHPPNRQQQQYTRNDNFDRRGGSHHHQQQRPHQQSFGHSQPPPIRLIPGQPPPFTPPSHWNNQNNRGNQARQYSQHPHQQQHQQHQQGYRNRHNYGGHGDRSASVNYSENDFAVHPLHQFKGKCVQFQQPIEIGSFSYTEKREFVMDDSQLKYYFPPDLSKPNNLSVNYDKYIMRDDIASEHIDALLDALMCIKDREDDQNQRNEESNKEAKLLSQGDNADSESSGNNSGSSEKSTKNNKGSATKADFVCYRGLLTKIMCTPYTRNEPWEFGATLYKGTIYIEEHITEEKVQASRGTGRHQLMSYWGYRFETICNISKPVSELRRTRIRKRALNPATASSSPEAEAKAQAQHPDHGDDSGKGQISDYHPDSISSSNEVDYKSTVRVLSEQDGVLRQKEGSPSENCKISRLKIDPAGSEASTAAVSFKAETVDNRDDDDGSGDDDEYIEQIDLEDPELTGRLDGIVDNNLQYCTVARTKIGGHSIIMGAEVDCISEPKKPHPFNPLSHYIELKTSRAIRSDRDRNNFE